MNIQEQSTNISTKGSSSNKNGKNKRHKQKKDSINFDFHTFKAKDNQKFNSVHKLSLQPENLRTVDHDRKSSTPQSETCIKEIIKNHSAK